MSKIALASGSFMVGACCTLLAASFIHTSTRLQAESSQIQLFGTGDAEPLVPGLRLRLEHAGGIGLPGLSQSLDGLDCDDCTLGVGKLTYAGGAFRLKDAHIPRGIPVELKGAALNTVTLLSALGAFPSPSPAPPTPVPPQTAPPKMQTPKPQIPNLEIKPNSSWTLASLEGIAHK